MPLSDFSAAGAAAGDGAKAVAAAGAAGWRASWLVAGTVFAGAVAVAVTGLDCTRSGLAGATATCGAAGAAATVVGLADSLQRLAVGTQRNLLLGINRVGPRHLGDSRARRVLCKVAIGLSDPAPAA